MLEYIILGTLFDRVLTGYDIKKCIEQGIGMFYKGSYGSIYPILGRLLEKNYVEVIEDKKGKLIKKQYTITKEGKDIFLNWLMEEDRESNIESFMARVFFFDKLPRETSYQKIEEYQGKIEAYRENLLIEKEKYEKLENQENFYFKLSTLYFGICKLQSMIMWCETVKRGKKLEGLVCKKS